MELGSISDTSLQTPASYRPNTPTPHRQQTFEPEASGLRKESYRAQELSSSDNGTSTGNDTLRPKEEAQTLPAPDAPTEDSASHTGSHSHSATGLNDPSAQPWFAPSWRRSESSFLPSIPAPGSSALPNERPSASDTTTTQPSRERPDIHYGAISPRTYNSMLNGGVNPVDCAIQYPIGQPVQHPSAQNFGESLSENQSHSSNAAMLNGMYSLLSGNIYNLQLPEYQQWLHTVSQNQQLPPLDNIPGIHPDPNLPTMTPTMNQNPMGAFPPSADSQGMSNGQWNNFNLGFNLDSGLDVNGAMTDIWSMAPNNFEYVQISTDRVDAIY